MCISFAFDIELCHQTKQQWREAHQKEKKPLKPNLMKIYIALVKSYIV